MKKYYTDNLLEFINNVSTKNVVVWGFTRRACDIFDVLMENKVNCICFGDNDTKKQCEFYKKQYPVLSIESIKSRYNDYKIIIVSQSYMVIKEQLVLNGISESDIFIYCDETIYEYAYNNKSKIIITGIGLVNKGSESMALNAIANMKQRYPEYDLIVWDYMADSYSKYMKEDYKFPIDSIPNHEETVKLCHNNLDNERLINLDKILRNTDYMLDFSGYVFSSDFCTSVQKQTTITYLCQFIISQKYNLKLFIMPQSFGKMDYDEEIMSLADQGFVKAQIIYAREKQGYYNLMNTFSNINVRESIDSVFFRVEEYDITSLCKAKSTDKICTLNSNVAIIPNIGLLNYQSEEDILDMYEKIITYLSKLEKNIYLIVHCSFDKILCEKIKKHIEYPNLYIIDDDINSIGFLKMIPKFDFFVASRYHAIVHSILQSVPGIILGWDEKYTELSNMFDLDDFCFNINNCIPTTDALYKALSKIEKNKTVLSTRIKELVKFYQKNNIFSEVK